MGDNIEFRVVGKEVLRLSVDGFEYRDELLKDAGLAHEAFMEFMAVANGKMKGLTDAVMAMKPYDEHAFSPYDSTHMAYFCIFCDADEGHKVGCPVVKLREVLNNE